MDLYRLDYMVTPDDNTTLDDAKNAARIWVNARTNEAANINPDGSLKKEFYADLTYGKEGRVIKVYSDATVARVPAKLPSGNFVDFVNEKSVIDRMELSVSQLHARIDGLPTNSSTQTTYSDVLINKFFNDSLITVSEAPSDFIKYSPRDAVVGDKIYNFYRISTGTKTLKLDIYNITTNTFTVIDSGLPLVANIKFSVTPDTVNNKIYILIPFNHIGYDPESTIDRDAKIYTYDIINNTFTLLTTSTEVLTDITMHYKNNKLYFSPCRELSEYVVDEDFTVETFNKFKIYDLATNLWETKILLDNKYPKDYTVKYSTGASNTVSTYFEVLPELEGQDSELWYWYFGDIKATKVYTFDRYEMDATLSRGVGLCTVNFKEYVIKHVVNEGVNYLLIVGVDNKKVKRVLLNNNALTKYTNLVCVGTVLYIFDKSTTLKTYKIDIGKYLI